MITRKHLLAQATGAPPRDSLDVLREQERRDGLKKRLIKAGVGLVLFASYAVATTMSGPIANVAKELWYQDRYERTDGK